MDSGQENREGAGTLPIPNAGECKQFYLSGI